MKGKLIALWAGKKLKVSGTSLSAALENPDRAAWLKVGYRQFFYQECTELGYFQISSPDAVLTTMPSAINTAWFQQFCQTTYGITSPPDVATTTKNYFLPLSSQAVPLATNIVAVTGASDYWSNLSARPGDPRFSSGINRFKVPLGKHCEDMVDVSNAGNGDEVEVVRNKIMAIVKTWLK
jgi:hypothetical protein